jgi:invasion protein IalB
VFHVQTPHRIGEVALAEFACRNVWDDHAPVLYVAHNQNDDWQVLCGGNEHDDPKQCVVLHKEHLAERDPSIEEVFDLERGWEAERAAVDGPWERRPCDEDEDANKAQP